MPARKKNALTDALITKASKRKGKFKLTDGGGLSLVFNNPGGTPTWLMRYRSKGKETYKIVGKWPDMSLAQARKIVAASRKVSTAATRAISPEGSRAQPDDPRRWFAAAGAALELVESLGFEWNGALWIAGPKPSPASVIELMRAMSPR